jgi:hypothetical protein
MQPFLKSEEEGTSEDVEIAFNKSRYYDQYNALNGGKVEYRCTWIIQSETLFSEENFCKRPAQASQYSTSHHFDESASHESAILHWDFLIIAT